jgi:hypothetical protein
MSQERRMEFEYITAKDMVPAWPRRDAPRFRALVG